MSKKVEKTEAKEPAKSKVPLEEPDLRLSPEMKAQIARAEEEKKKKAD